MNKNKNNDDGNEVSNDDSNDNTVSYREVFNDKTNKHALTDLYRLTQIQTYKSTYICASTNILINTYSLYLHVCTRSHSS